MPDLNGRGQLLAGVGDGYVSIDRTVVGLGGVACWLDDDRAIYNGHSPVDGTWKTLVYDQRTGQTDIVGPSATFLVARGGRWAAGNPAHGNFTTAPGSVLSLARTDGRGAAGDDGTIALCPDQSCAAFDLYAPDGSVLRVLGVAYDLCILGPQQAVWSGGAVNVELRPALTPAQAPRVADVAGERWLVYWADGVGLVAHVDGETSGYVLETRPVTFHPRARAVNGTLYVAWSEGVGELPQEQVLAVVTRTSVVFPFDRTRSSPTWQPLREDVPSVPAIGRPLLLAWFTDGETNTPGNADLYVDYHGGPAENLVRLRGTREPVARYVAAEAEGDLAALNTACRAARALEPRLPVIAYCPAGFIETLGVPSEADILGIEAYRHLDETLGQCADRILRVLLACGGWRLALIPQDYTSNAGNHPDVAALVPAIAKLAIASTNVLAILPFSAGSRAGGWNDTPEAARQAWRALAAGVPGTPQLPAPRPEPPAPPSPKPVQTGGNLMQFASLEASKVVPYKQLKPSAQAGCVNVILPDDRVFSAHGDDRDPGTDGPWEQGQVAGNAITFRADGQFFTYLLVPVDKLP